MISASTIHHAAPGQLAWRRRAREVGKPHPCRRSILEPACLRKRQPRPAEALHKPVGNDEVDLAVDCFDISHRGSLQCALPDDRRNGDL